MQTMEIQVYHAFKCYFGCNNERVDPGIIAVNFNGFYITLEINGACSTCCGRNTFALMCVQTNCSFTRLYFTTFSLKYTKIDCSNIYYLGRSCSSTAIKPLNVTSGWATSHFFYLHRMFKIVGLSSCSSMRKNTMY